MIVYESELSGSNPPGWSVVRAIQECSIGGQDTIRVPIMHVEAHDDHYTADWQVKSSYTPADYFNDISAIARTCAPETDEARLLFRFTDSDDGLGLDAYKMSLPLDWELDSQLSSRMAIG
jgi:hypothetical protein